MTAPSMTWRQILACDPCAGQRDTARNQIKTALPDYAKRKLTLADAAAAGVDFDGLIWIAGRAAEADPDCARRIRLFGADCAARVAHIANDPRSTAAIVAARQFVEAAKVCIRAQNVLLDTCVECGMATDGDEFEFAARMVARWLVEA